MERGDGRIAGVESMEMDGEEGTCSDEAIDRTLIHCAARYKASCRDASDAIHEACVDYAVCGDRVHCDLNDALREASDPRGSSANGANDSRGPLGACCSNERAEEEEVDGGMGSDDGR